MTSMAWTDLDEMFTSDTELMLEASPPCIQTAPRRCVDIWPDTTELWCLHCSLEVGVYLWHAEREAAKS